MKRKLLAVSVMACLLFVAFGGAQERFRVEKDLLGEKQIPADALYGVQTARALENFPVSGVLINHYPGFVEAHTSGKGILEIIREKDPNGSAD